MPCGKREASCLGRHLADLCEVRGRCQRAAKMLAGIDFWLAVTIMLGVVAGLPVGLALDHLWQAIAKALYWRITHGSE